MVTIFNCYKLLKPIFWFSGQPPWDYIGKLFGNVGLLLSCTVGSSYQPFGWILCKGLPCALPGWSDLFLRGRARKKFQAGLLQERTFRPSPGRWRDSAEGLQMRRMRTQQQIWSASNIQGQDPLWRRRFSLASLWQKRRPLAFFITASQCTARVSALYIYSARPRRIIFKYLWNIICQM